MKEENEMERLASHRIHGILPLKYHMQYRSGQEPLVEEQSLKEVEEMILTASENLSTPESLTLSFLSDLFQFTTHIFRAQTLRLT